MATYEYRCTNGHTYIEQRSMTEEDTVTTCQEPNCGEDLKRIYNTSAVIFRGSGFYSTGG